MASELYIDGLAKYFWSKNTLDLVVQLVGFEPLEVNFGPAMQLNKLKS
jgi:hypothetical protein